MTAILIQSMMIEIKGLNTMQPFIPLFVAVLSYVVRVKRAQPAEPIF